MDDRTHGDADTCPCEHCGTRIRLSEDGYIVATMTEDLGRYRDKTLHRFCDSGCYANWAQAARRSRFTPAKNALSEYDLE